MESVEDLTIGRIEEGEEVIKELDKVILTRGVWATIMYLYEEYNARTAQFVGPKARIVRYKKVRGRYIPNSKFNISSGKQARQMVEVFQKWFPPSVESTDSVSNETDEE